MKSIVITGTSTGIGYACSKHFIEKGYKVFGSVRNDNDANRVSNELGSNFVPLIFDVTDETAALNDGSANAIVLGGVPPYSYNWSNGSATNPNLNLSPGLYTVDVIDANGCIVSTSVTVNAYTTTDIIDIENDSKNLRNITDMLGQETPYRRNTPLFYIYDDGTVEKKIVLD